MKAHKMKRLLVFVFTFIVTCGFSQNKKELIYTINKLKSDSANLQLKVKNNICILLYDQKISK